MLLVLIHPRALAALFGTSQSTIDRVLHHLIPLLAGALRPTPDTSEDPGIIDGTLIPVHDQSITAISKNYRRSVNTQIIICAHARDRGGPLLARQPQRRRRRPRNRRAPSHRATKSSATAGYRGIATITTPRRDHTGRIIHDEHYRTHRRIRARVEHVPTRSKTDKASDNAAAAASNQPQHPHHHRL